jgi:hypothetical protein
LCPDFLRKKSSMISSDTNKCRLKKESEKLKGN